MIKKELLFCVILFSASMKGFSASTDDLELVDPADISVLLEEDSTDLNVIENSDLNLSDVEELDDLQAIREDSANLRFEDAPSQFAQEPEIEKPTVKPTIVNEKKSAKGKAIAKTDIFEVGAAEAQLLKESKMVIGKIPNKEWFEIASASKVERYEVKDGDWLWKISKRLFGSGFYYSKVWALNPQITNPHEIEPGMVLSFSTGTEDDMPNVQLSEFSEEISERALIEKRKKGKLDYRDFSDSEPPAWVEQRKDLQSKGAYFQYISEETYDDLEDIGKRALITEFEKYEPPYSKIVIKEPGQNYDSAGFDKNSKIEFDFSEGFYLNTFVVSNIMIDLGKVESAQNTQGLLQKFDKVFVAFDDPGRIKPGDLFSAYRPGGKVKHETSDREGHKYTIVGQLKALKKVGRLWECEIFEISDLLVRGERITTYMSKINKIYKTFSKRVIEASVVAGYVNDSTAYSYGDVVYIDRGRIDGVELGNVFEIYSTKDGNTEKRISTEPAYKIGELTTISLSDNFATALVTSSRDYIEPGVIVVSKTVENAMRDERIKKGGMLKGVKKLETDALDNLDIELNLDDINEDLLNKADKIKLTDDELQELERQEREKSIIKEHEKDLKELERLENEIAEAEAELNEARVDEDKFLEQTNLDKFEKTVDEKDPNAFGSLDDIEKEQGMKFMDQDINSKENPYGLTEFDLEEIDELLNTESNKQ